MIQVKYINHLGQELDLSSDNYQIDLEALLNYNWNIDASDKGNFASKVSRFYRNSHQDSIIVTVYANSSAELQQNLTTFYETVEKDVLTNKSGKMKVGDYYYDCFIVSAENQYWNDPSQIVTGKFFANKTISLYSPRPFWYKEETPIFFGREQSTTPEDTEHIKFYPHGYDYDYYSTAGIERLIANTNIDSADFRMEIFGATEEPYVLIGGHNYSLRANLGVNERLVLDTRDKTFVKVLPNGQQVNMFNYRGLDDYIFEKIPSGNSRVQWSGAFAFSIQMYQRRSEPIWSYGGING